MKKPDLSEILSKPTCSLPEAGSALGVGRNPAYEAAKRGEIPTVQIGRLKRVPTSWLRRVLGLDQQQAA